MKIESMYPVLCVEAERLNETWDFYVNHFRMKPTFESDWYVSLIRPDEGFQLALLDYRHPSLPAGFGAPAAGVLLNLEVDDVDAEYARLSGAGLPVHLELRSEDWGQRHFITADPNGVLIDVIQLIAPSEEFARQYDEETANALLNR